MSPRQPNWHDQVRFGLHFDLHANAGDTELGRDLTEGHLIQRLLLVRPDWIQCDCKGHPGYTSWPTEVGTTSPGVVQDALRIHRDVTRRMGIPLVMHYSGVWDSRAVELHPEWAVVDAQGNRSPNNTCRLSAYDDELLIPQMIELIDNYDIDGFWVDGENWASQPCWCDRCAAEFRSRTGVAEPPRSAEDVHWDAWLAFHRELFEAHVAHYTEAVHARKPECTVCSNWMSTVRQPEPVRVPVDYLSGDYDWAWGADRAAIEGRLLDGRKLAGEIASWDLMAWGFIKSGDMRGEVPWCTKPVAHLCQEVAEVVALGGAVQIYDQPQRAGKLTDWHMITFGEVAAFCRQRQPHCFGTTSASEAAVLHLAPHYYAHNDPLYNYGQAVQPVEGALHALLECQLSTDVLTEEAALSLLDRYKLVVVPEQTRLTDELVTALEAYAEAGGQVLLSGAHLAAEHAALVGATRVGDEPARGWLPVEGHAVPLWGDWHAVSPADGAEAVTTALRQQEALADATDQVLATRRRVGQGAIVAIHGPVFRSYFQAHYPLLRRWLGGLIDELGIDWRVRVAGPPQLEVVTREDAGRLVINLINRGAAETLSPRRVIVESIAPATDVAVVVRREASPAVVTVVPEDTPLSWTHEDGLLSVELPRVDIHTVLVIE